MKSLAVPPVSGFHESPNLREQNSGRLFQVFLAIAAVVGMDAAGVNAGETAKGERAGSALASEEVDFFEKSIRPMLVESCQKCHGSAKQSSGLRLDSREAILKGGSLGPAIVPGKPDESLLVQVVAQTHEDVKMPPKGKLSDPAVAALRRWVESGAPWGHRKSDTQAGDDGARNHWAFRPVRPSPPPAVKDLTWIATPVDAFVLAKLEGEGLTPSPRADRRALIRRATFDLLGIPPTAEEVDAFEKDGSPDAFARLVDRLLASPLYGERWGRHWLDVARYADTKGYVFQEERRYPFAFTYRDFVIHAFNADLPFDKFLLYQIAADKLPLGDDAGPLAAMGFLTVGRRFLNDQNEIIDDRIDLIGRGLLGLTISCARCHDHKFDPIPTEDYYSLYGVFASSVEPRELPRLPSAGKFASPKGKELERRLQIAQKDRDDYIAQRRAEFEKDVQTRFSKYLRAAAELDFNARNPQLTERAKADQLAQQRLRGVMVLWKQRLESADAKKDPVLAPWRAFADLPRESFAVNAGEIVRKLSAEDHSNGARIHPLVARAFTTGGPPKGMKQVAARYADLFAQLETRSQARTAAADQRRPDWESLHAALFGPKGLLRLPADSPPRFLLDRPEREKFTRLNNAVDKLQTEMAGEVRRAMVMNDAPRPTDPRVFIRGNPGRPGNPVPRQFLQILSGPGRQPFKDGSGRLELAQAIVDPRNPLTARVLVNRVWHWHFGQGLVTTPSDFGLRSDPPSHPELLDHLAADFMANGWSVKALHRQIMLSNTYQQRSAFRPDCLVRDAQNRLLWRFNRQRLDFETMRDSVLAVAGRLDNTQGGPAVAINEPPFPPRRTVYGFIDRQNLDGVYRTFDFAVPDASSPRRFVTTVPQQALFLMNSPFIQEQARRLADDLEHKQTEGSASADYGSRVREVYRRVLAREPEPRELAVGTAFCDRQERTAPASSGLSPIAQLAQVLMLTNEFMFVD